MDIDPVETTTEDSDETTTHIKTDTTKLQKRLNKYQRQPNRTGNDKSYPKKNETQATKSRHRSTSRSKEIEKNQKPTPNSPIETKNKFKMEIEMDLTPTIKKPGELKQKAQAPIVQVGRVHTNTEVISERPGGTFKLPLAKFNAVPSPSRAKSPMGIDKVQRSGINRIPTKII